MKVLPCPPPPSPHYHVVVMTRCDALVPQMTVGVALDQPDTFLDDLWARWYQMDEDDQREDELEASEEREAIAAVGAVVASTVAEAAAADDPELQQAICASKTTARLEEADREDAAREDERLLRDLQKWRRHALKRLRPASERAIDAVAEDVCTVPSSAESLATMEATTRFPLVGNRVSLHSLRSHPQLNGQQGFVEAVTDVGRYAVRLTSKVSRFAEGAAVNVWPSNVSATTTPPPPPPPTPTPTPAPKNTPPPAPAFAASPPPWWTPPPLPPPSPPPSPPPLPPKGDHHRHRNRRRGEHRSR